MLSGMLEVINALFGYERYRTRQRQENWYIDVLDPNGDVNIYAERMGTYQEVYYFIAGMYQIASRIDQFKK